MLSPVDIMIQNRHLQSEAAFAAYGQSLKALKEAPKDPTLLPRLISVFCDVEDFEVYWMLFHYVESFPREAYVPALIEATPQLLLDGQEWLRRLYLRVLNSDSYRATLKVSLEKASPQQQAAVRQILEQIPFYTGEDLRQNFAEKVAFVLSSEQE
jgi:hypothetical protein